MPQQKKSFFTRKKEEPAQSAEESHKTAKTRLLLSVGRLLKNARNILHSAHALYSANLFPAETTETEKAALKESLIALANRKKEIEQTKISLGAMTPEEREGKKNKKKSIHHEFRQALQQIDAKAKEALNPVVEEKRQITAELKQIKEEYMQKRSALLERKKGLTEKKKELEKEQKIKHIAAANARSRSLSEIEEAKEEAMNPSELVSADKLATAMKTDINRVKGILTAIFAGEQDEKNVRAIMNGKLEAPIHPTPAPKENTVKPDEEISPKTEDAPRQKTPTPISSEESIPLPAKETQKEEQKTISPQTA